MFAFIDFQIKNSTTTLTPKTIDIPLFPKQIDFVNDLSKFKVAVCSRRSGKSYAAAVMLLRSLSISGSTNTYCALSRLSAKKIIWGVLKKLSLNFYPHLDLKFNETELSVICERLNSRLYCTGVENPNVKETLRGVANDIVVIDECASYSDAGINELIDDVLVPSLLDRKGSLVLIGTPGEFNTYFYRAAHSQAFSKHHWDLFDNPYISDQEAFINMIKSNNCWDDQNPTLLREYFGLWVHDDSTQVYKYNPSKNLFKECPLIAPLTIIGVDLGYKDKTSIAIIQFNPKESDLTYIVEICALKRVGIHDIAQKINEYQNKYKNIISIKGDTGGLGLFIVEDLKKYHHIHIDAAVKTTKHSAIEVLNAALVTGKLKVHENCIGLIKEWEGLTWSYKTDGSRIENQSLPNDHADSVLYAFRASYSYTWEEKEATYGAKIEDWIPYKVEEKVMLR